MMLSKIRHGCRTHHLPDGSLKISGGFHFQLPVDATVVAKRGLVKQFEKYPCQANQHYLLRYYDSRLEKFIDVVEDCLLLMFGKRMSMRIVLMSVHIVNDQTGEELVINDEKTYPHVAAAGYLTDEDKEEGAAADDVEKKRKGCIIGKPNVVNGDCMHLQ